jgi:hypothetical protein
VSLWALLGAAIAGWALAVVLLFAAYARPMRAAWREPVWRTPVLVLESDDWGAGPPEDASALRALAAVLLEQRDSAARPAVATLGLVLACADAVAARGAPALGYTPPASGGDVPPASGEASPASRPLPPAFPDTPPSLREPPPAPPTYRRVTLEDRRFAPILAAIREGAAQGCFAPQLHGLEHFRPQSVCAAAAADLAVREWLARTCAPAAELPSPLQSRWTDASVLPSRPLEPAEVRDMAREECALYGRLFGAPRVVVPPTFVWTAAVEEAWAASGVEVIVTPGRRCTRREADGTPGGVDATMRQGERSPAGPLYVVRNVYFEPALGHRSERLVRGLQDSAHLGRPCLVEMHRFNFIGEPASAQASLDELRRALADARGVRPDVRFLSTAEIGRILAGRDAEWLDASFRGRLASWVARLAELPRFAKLSRISGAALPLRLIGRWAAAGGRT